MKSRKRLGSENVMNIDGFADGNAISDLNSEFRRKQGGGYQAGTTTGPRNTGPRNTGPRNTCPRTTSPRNTGPRNTSPRTTGPRNTGPRSTGPRNQEGTTRKPRRNRGN